MEISEEKYKAEGLALKEKLLELSQKEQAIHVFNIGSEKSILYSLNVPFQITYEYCSGAADDDYLNILTLHEGGSLFYVESVGLHNRYNFIHMPPHYHDYYEYMIVIDGAVRQQIDGNDYLYPAGTCCLINRNLSHKEYYYPGARVLYLGFSVKALQELFSCAEHSRLREERAIFDTDMYRFIAEDLLHPGRHAYLDFIPLYRNESGTARLKALTEEVMRRFLFPAFGSSRMIDGLLCEILSYISSRENYHCTVTETTRSSDYLIFARTTRLLEENDGRLSRRDIAARINYSADYVNRIVRKYSGMCLSDYRHTFAMKRAAQLLLSTPRSVSDIAAALGFSNRTYFYRLFTLRYGMTPRAYRTQAKGG